MMIEIETSEGLRMMVSPKHIVWIKDATNGRAYRGVQSITEAQPASCPRGDSDE